MYNIQNVSTCTTSQILAAPPSAGAEVSVDGIQLIPSPYVNITIEKNVVNDTIIGGIMKIQLNGFVKGYSFNEVAAGCDKDGNEITNKTHLKKILELAKTSCCVHVIIKCGCDFIDGYGRIISASIPEGNDPTWVTQGSYTLDIELYNNKNTNDEYVGVVSAQNDCPQNSSSPDPSGSPDPCKKELMLKDINESFSISIDEDSYNWGVVDNDGTLDESVSNLLEVGRRHAKVSFSISAKGVGGGSGDSQCFPQNNSGEDGSEPNVLFGLAAAEKYIKCRINKLIKMDLSGISGAPNLEIVPTLNIFAGGASYLDFRTLEVNPIDQSIGLTGDIIYRPSGCNEDVFTNISVEENVDNEGSQITISGEIEGLASPTYDATVAFTDELPNIISASYLNDSQCLYNDKMDRANAYFQQLDKEETFKSIAEAHCKKSIIVVKCINTEGQEEDILPCLSTSPSPTPSPTSSSKCNLQLISRQVSKDYAAGTINFTFVFTNKDIECSTIKGVSSIEIEAIHDLPKDNIVETVVPGRGKKGVLIQNLCCLSADRWTFNVTMTLQKGKKIPSAQLKTCARNAIQKYITDSNITPDPHAGCWFVTDHQENFSPKTYKYNIQYTKPSC